MAESLSPPNLAELLRSTEAKPGDTKVLSIDGHGGSGKSTLASLLAEKFGAEIVHTDDFASWNNPKDWWPQLIDLVLDPVAAGAKTLSYPTSQWWPDHHPEPVIDQPVTKVLILEGVSALRKEFRQYLGFGIFITAPREVCLKRGLARDAGQGREEEVLKLWQRWYEDEVGYIERDAPERYANVVVDGTRPFAEQLDLRGVGQAAAE